MENNTLLKNKKGKNKMIIGIGEHPPFIIDVLREIKSENLFIFPEFFDDKRNLLSRNYRNYILKLAYLRDNVIIAVYPDYFYEYNLLLEKISSDIIFVFPLHSKNELDFVLKLSDKMNILLGFPYMDKLRDYDIGFFLEIAKKYDFKTWLLGYKKSLKKYLNSFYGMDITPIACGLYLKNLKKYIDQYIKCINGFLSQSLITEFII